MPVLKSAKPRGRKVRRVFCVLLVLLLVCLAFWGGKTVYENNDTAQLNVPYMTQEGFLPTGCETVSAMMALSFLGMETDAEDILSHMEMEPLTTGAGGRKTGPSPEEAFVGDPRSDDGYGCYPPVIKNAFEGAYPNAVSVTDTTGVSFNRLAHDYVKNGIPVLVWATVDMQPARQGTQWRLSTGELFTWPRGEHCLLLVGYDGGNYYFNDPYGNRGRISYPKEQVNARYKELGSKSAVIMRVDTNQTG